MADEGVVVSNSASSSNADYTVAVDTVGGKEYQRVKLDAGADGALVPVVAGQQLAAASLPVVLASDQGTLPVSVSGVATAAKQDTIIGHVDGIEGLLTTIDGDTGALAACASGSELQVDIVTSALPTGAATSAKQDTIIGHVDGIEGLLTTIGADTGALAACASGTELQVDIVTSALPTGAATAANQTTIIGHVDGIETLLGTTNTNTGNSATSLAVIDDWDESDRCKVNPIVGQAGVAAGAGAVGATVQRVTLASDDPAVASLSVLDDWDNAASDGVSVSGDVAHDAADAGEPVKIGAKAANALPTAVANNDRANAIADLFGRILTSHIDPAMQVVKAVTVTAQQTGSDVWTPTSGKRIAVTHLTISSYGTTGGRAILWFGDNADTTYSAGTDQVLWAGSFVPSATIKPGAVIPFPHPAFCTTADRELHLTTDAAISLDITVHGYEW